MPTFIMLSTLGPDGAATLRDNPERIRSVTAEVEAMGVKVVAQYALLGDYDFLNIIEAPDHETMVRLAVELGSRGTLKTRTMPALPLDQFVAAIANDSST
jgi:uncharacterized protein with GYD domain